MKQELIVPLLIHSLKVVPASPDELLPQVLYLTIAGRQAAGNEKTRNNSLSPYAVHQLVQQQENWDESWFNSYE